MAVLTRARTMALAGATALAVAAPLAPATPVATASAAPIAQVTMANTTATAVPAISRFRARQKKVMQTGKALIGVPYVYGGSTPRGFDCSGFTLYVYRKAVGMSLPHSATLQMHKAKRISKSQRKRGDLVFFRSGSRAYHVGIYAGRGRVLHSPRPGQRVHVARIWTSNVTYGRLL